MKCLAAILVQQKAPWSWRKSRFPPVADRQVWSSLLQRDLRLADRRDQWRQGARPLPAASLGARRHGHRPGVRRRRPDRQAGRQSRAALAERGRAGIDRANLPFRNRQGQCRLGHDVQRVCHRLRESGDGHPQRFRRGARPCLAVRSPPVFGVINNNAQLKIGQSIAIFGAGGIGLNIVQGAAMVSAYPIIAVDLFDNRLELAKRLGGHALHQLHRRRTPRAKSARSSARAGLDVAVDNTGNVKVIETAYRLTGPRGRTVLVGVPPKESAAAIYTLPLHFEKTLTGSHGGESRPEVDIPNYVRLCSARALRLASLIGKRYSLPDINQAIHDMRSGAIAGCALIEVAASPGDNAAIGGNQRETFLA